MNKAASTRLHILEQAFALIYRQGYQATSIDDIIASTQVTKGAFFYHFKTKDEMGLAVLTDLLQPVMRSAFIAPLLQSSDPRKAIYQAMRELLLNNAVLKVAYGCPAANLTQEMTPWNTAFSRTLAQLAHEWEHAMQQAILTGKKNGTVRKNVNAREVVYFVVAGYWGIRNFGKLYNSKNPYQAWLRELKKYLNGLGEQELPKKHTN